MTAKLLFRDYDRKRVRGFFSRLLLTPAMFLVLFFILQLVRRKSIICFLFFIQKQKKNENKDDFTQ